MASVLFWTAVLEAQQAGSAPARARMDKELRLEELPGLLERARAQLSPQDYATLEELVRMGRALQELDLLGRSAPEIESILQEWERQAPSGSGPESAR